MKTIFRLTLAIAVATSVTCGVLVGVGIASEATKIETHSVDQNDADVLGVIFLYIAGSDGSRRAVYDFFNVIDTLPGVPD